MKQRGVTLVELIFFIVFGAIILGIGLQFLLGAKSDYTYGINGAMETRCMSGVKVVIGRTGHPIQLFDTNGNGIACEEVK